jgi:hypothetical protein
MRIDLDILGPFSQREWPFAFITNTNMMKRFPLELITSLDTLLPWWG